MHKYEINQITNRIATGWGGGRGRKLIEHMGLDFVSAFKNIWILNTELHNVLVLKPQKGTKCIVKHKNFTLIIKKNNKTTQKIINTSSQKVLKIKYL